MDDNRLDVHPTDQPEGQPKKDGPEQEASPPAEHAAWNQDVLRRAQQILRSFNKPFL
jgi:hypothetical protein